MKLQYTSSITRYEGDYPSLSAFLMSIAPKESDRESFLSRAEGNFRGGRNGFSLSYKEENGTSASIVYEGDMLRFTRGITQAAFSLSRITSFSYVTDLGAMPVSAYTERLDVMERDGKLLLTLSYFMHISGMVQKTVMKWKLF